MKKLPILQITLVVLLIAVIAFGFSMNKKKTDVTEVSKVETEATGTISDTSADAELALKESLYEKQKQALEEERNQYNYINEATDAWNSELCAKIKDTSLRLQCSDNVYSAKANKEKDAAMCLKIQATDTKTKCQDGFVYEWALAKNDASQCDNIKGNALLSTACKKNIVFNQVSAQGFTGTTDTCMKYLSGSDQQACIKTIESKSDIATLQTTIASKNAAGCASITDANLRNICNDGIYYAKAMETKDSALCEKVVDISKKTYCKTTLAAENDDVLVQKAMTTNDINTCALVLNGTKKNDCTNSLSFRLAIQNKDVTMCEKILRTDMKATCIDTVSKMAK